MFRHIPAASWTPLSSNNFPMSSSTATTIAQPTIISNEFSSSSFLSSSTSATIASVGSSFLLSPLPPPSAFDSSSSSSFSSSSNFRSFIVPPVPSSFLLPGHSATDAAASANQNFHTENEVQRSLQHSSVPSFLEEAKLDTIQRSKQDGVYGRAFGEDSLGSLESEESQSKKAPAFGYHQNLELSVSASDSDSLTGGASLLVQDCPDYFDKYSSFYSSLPSAAVILDELKDVFVHVSLPEDQIMDFDFGKSSATIKCQTFVHCSPLQFRVSVFKNNYFPAHPQQAKFIVEFQKREGCCIAFRHVYKLLREKMSSQLRCGDVATPLGNVVPPCVSTAMAELTVSDKKSSAPQTQLSSSPSVSSYDSFSLTPRPKLDKDSARLLCEMASSDCIQSSREALRALCHASLVDRQAAAQAVTSSAEQFQSYFQMVSAILTECGNSTYSQDQELVRCCLQFITNLVESNSTEERKDGAHNCVEDIRSALFSHASQLAGAQLVKLCIEYINAFPHVFEDVLKLREIKRQSARFLCALAEVRTEELKSILQSDDVNVLELQANCEDVKLQQYIHHILTRVR